MVPAPEAATMNRIECCFSPPKLPAADPTPVAMRETTWHTAKRGMFTGEHTCVRRPFQRPVRGRLACLCGPGAFRVIHYRLLPGTSLPETSAGEGSGRGWSRVVGSRASIDSLLKTKEQ